MAEDINSLIIVGRLTRDAELKYTAAGQALSAFAVAVNRKVKRGDAWEEEGNFFDVVYWGRGAEAVNQYLLKGKQIAIDGSLKQDRWQDSEGNNRSKVVISADNVQLLGGQSQNGHAPIAGTGQAYQRNSKGAGADNEAIHSNVVNQGGLPPSGPPAPQSAPRASAAARFSTPEPQPDYVDDGFADDIPF